MKIVLSELTKFFTNKVGILLVLVNFISALLGLYMKGIAYYSFHFHYEPLPIKILTLLNLPAILFAELLFSTNESDKFGVSVNEYEFITIVMCSIFQWLLIGYILYKIFPEKELK